MPWTVLFSVFHSVLQFKWRIGKCWHSSGRYCSLARQHPKSPVARSVVWNPFTTDSCRKLVISLKRSPWNTDETSSCRMEKKNAWPYFTVFIYCLSPNKKGGSKQRWPLWGLSSSTDCTVQRWLQRNWILQAVSEGLSLSSAALTPWHTHTQCFTSDQKKAHTGASCLCTVITLLWLFSSNLQRPKTCSSQTRPNLLFYCF